MKTTEQKWMSYGGALLGSLTFAVTDSFWFNAVEAEVYAMSMFFTSIVVWLILLWAERADEEGNERYLLLIAYMIGLATGVHLLNLLTLPMIALILYYRKFKPNLKTFSLATILTGIAFLLIYKGIIKGIPQIAKVTSLWFILVVILTLFGLTYYYILRDRKYVSLVLMCAILIIVGYSTYSLIFIRSLADPPIDENDPDTIPEMVSYLEREQYGDFPILDRRRWTAETRYKYSGQWDFFWKYQVGRMYIRYFLWQFVGRKKNEVDWLAYRLIPLLIGILGMTQHFYKDNKRALSLLVLFFMTGLAIIIYLNQEDPQPRERDYSYVGSFFAFSVWIGIGAAAIFERLYRYVRFRSVPASSGLFAALFLIMPINMLIKNYHEHDRTGNYVAWDYSYNILQTLEPNAIVFTNGDNDTFPLWFLQEVEGVRKDVRVVNLSLLNTHWYIKQLKNQEPRVPINMSDEQIDHLYITQWPIPGRPTTVEISVPENVGKGIKKITFDVKPTLKARGIQGLRIQDIMVLHIIQANNWRKPIYFAVTVSPENKLGMDEYLRMDGLAFKIVPQKGVRIVPEILRTNLLRKYKYRNLNDKDVFFNDNIRKLIQNYRSGFLQLAYYYYSQNNSENLAAILDSMQVAIPEEVIPISRKDVVLQVGRFYFEAGRPEELERRLEYVLNYRRPTFRDKLAIASIYMNELQYYAKAEQIFSELVSIDSISGPAVGGLVRVYELTERLDKAISLLDRWLAKFPEDKNAARIRDSFLEKMGSPDSGDSLDLSK